MVTDQNRTFFNQFTRMGRMELKWLEDFVMLANVRSFSKAAELRFVTQPAFSRRIRALENWLGTPLVDRSTYPTTLTDAGRQFRETAEEILRSLQEARDEFSNRERRGRATLRFSALHTIALTFFPEWLYRVEENMEDQLNVSLAPGNLHDVVQSLVDGDCDFLLCFNHEAMPVLLDPQKYPSIRLAGEALMLVGPADGDGAAKYPLQPGEAEEKIPLLSYSPDCFFGRMQETLMAGQGLGDRFRHVYENPMAEALKAMALAGHGLAWLPESAIRQELDDGRLVEVGTEDHRISFDIQLYRSLEKARPLVSRFWNNVSDLTD